MSKTKNIKAAKELAKIRKKATKLKKISDWDIEVNKRIEFGIPISQMPSSIGMAPAAMFKYKDDFETLWRHGSQRIRKGDSKEFADRIKLYRKCISLYTRYTFKQLEDCDGALQVSKTCPMAYFITNNDYEYNGKRMAIYHRIKNAVAEGDYPEKVLQLFKNDSKCRAVFYLYHNALQRFVLIEKDSAKLAIQRAIRNLKNKL